MVQYTSALNSQVNHKQKEHLYFYEVYLYTHIAQYIIIYLDVLCNCIICNIANIKYQCLYKIISFVLTANIYMTLENLLTNLYIGNNSKT